MSDSTRQTGFGMMLVAALAMLGGLTWFFSDRLEQRSNPNRVVESERVGDRIDITLRADRQGHYVATGEINRTEVTFLVDTGATLVSVPEELADQLGLERQAPIGLQTAAGPVQGYLTRLDEVRLGDIVQRDVRAAINPGRHDTVLLGMSFLRDLELVHRDGELTLRTASLGTSD
ncbi:retropepsin-like aspartic protease family protein [Wenzhouxiangella marina]|uniref:Aspartyl protease n=1 Tax=Wenzhouxiangella marina TaxID=1579979 RepID=A0A0K0XZ62_9GAMM|nr:TIGR02281 family clan AA aspartic protease [Wenzhouxiangella marina]AKS42974.1 aspartyl protease [Wenzhouxiangella marina]MBB6087342.1 aspartyl protease family protein [Wenzhouxiangella marina]